MNSHIISSRTLRVRVDVGSGARQPDSRSGDCGVRGDYTVPPGATLELISSRCYGDRYYGFIVAAVNDLQNADRIRAGQVLRLPSLRQFLTERGVAKMAPAEVELLLAAHLDYRAMEDELWSRLRAAPDSSADDDRQLGLPDEAATSLVKVANDLNQCADLLAARSERNSRTLRSAVQQLRSADRLLPRYR